MTWRVGLLIPSTNTVAEVDFYRSLPYDTTLHTARMYVEGTSADSQLRMLEQFALPAAHALASVMPHIVVLGSFSGGMLRGRAYDRELCDKVATATGAVAVSAFESVGQALRAAHATRVAVVTPYTDEASRAIGDAIEAEGVQVSALHGMGFEQREIASVTPEAIYSFVQTRMGLRMPGEALFLASADFHAMGALSLLKLTYDVPILTTNLAMLQAVRCCIRDLRDRDMAPAHTRRQTPA